ncbi:MAG: response regulator transcription factor [Cyanobacteria bacterium J06600_6]
MIKILLADDQYLMLEGIKAILKHEPEIEIVGTATDGKNAIEQAIKLQPDLVLIDIEMPRMNGIVATKYICEYMPDTKVIVLTSHKKQSYVTEALQAGASSYLLKDTLIQDLKQAIHSLGRGYSYIEAKLLTQAVDRIQTVKIVKYKEKVTYLKKHRKSIYKPTAQGRAQQLRRKRKVKSQTFSRNSASPGISKASLAPIFESPSTQEILQLNRQSSSEHQIYTTSNFNRRAYLRRLVWMLMAIASFVLSILIF